MLDLSIARNAIERMCESQRREGWKIGRVKKDTNTITNYREEEIVLVRDDLDGTVTFERPYLPEQIEQNRAEGNLIVSHSCLIRVPRDYVEFIKL